MRESLQLRRVLTVRLLSVLAVALAVLLAAACAPPPDENDADLNGGDEVVDEAAIALETEAALTFSGHWDEWAHAADLVGVELTHDGVDPAAFAGLVVYQWDTEHVYLGVHVADAVHSNPHAGDEIWQGDALEAGFWYNDTTLTFVLALLDDGELAVVQGVGDDLEEAVSYQVTRDEDAGTTLYEVGIPWNYFDEEVVIPSYVVQSSVSIKQSDGEELEFALDWTPGLSTVDPDPFLWARVTLENEDTLPLVE